MCTSGASLQHCISVLHTLTADSRVSDQNPSNNISSTRGTVMSKAPSQHYAGVLQHADSSITGTCQGFCSQLNNSHHSSLTSVALPCPSLSVLQHTDNRYTPDPTSQSVTLKFIEIRHCDRCFQMTRSASPDRRFQMIPDPTLPEPPFTACILLRRTQTRASRVTCRASCGISSRSALRSRSCRCEISATSS